MATEIELDSQPRVPLSRKRVLQAGVELADKGGIGSLSMRKLAHELGVEAMSLYYHVDSKEALLDGLVEVVLDEIEEAVGGFDVPANGSDWKTSIRERILSARQVLLRHPWAPTVLESRTTMSPQAIRYHDALLGMMRAGGFSYDLAHHALHALGSRALGFSQELFAPDDETDDENRSMEMLEEMADQIPHVVGMMMEVAHQDPDSTLGWCDDQYEFEFGLDLILDGLDRLREQG